MAVDTATTGLGALAANPASNDKFMVVDVSDTTMAPSGTNKYLDASYVSFRTNTETLTNKTLTAPVIGDFTYANHAHTNAAGGGQLDHGAALTGLGDDDHTQYLLATGTRTGASSQAQTFTNGVVVPTLRPASDNTAAVQIQTSAGGTFIVGDTTNRRVTISDGNTPLAALISTDVLTIAAEGTAPGAAIVSAGGSSGHRAVFKGVRARGTLASPTVPSADDDIVSVLGSIYDGSTTQGTAMIGALVDGSVSAGVAPARIAFYTSATTGAARAVRMTIKSDGKVGIGTTSPIAALHIIQSGTAAFVIGNGEADTTTKVGRMAVQHYTNAEEPLLVVGGASTSTANNIDFGGGSGVLNTATQITFFTAADTTTLTGTQRMRIDSGGLVAIGSHTAAAHLHIAGNLSANAWGTNGIAFRSAAATYTDANTAASGTATNTVANSFNTPTFAATNATVTMTNAATVYIAAAPTAGTNVTITNAYALWVDDGAARFDGNIGFFAKAPAAQQTSGADLTNNVTSGGTTDTIANFTDLTTYANDAAAIRNNFYQLSRKVKQINDALRLYGLLT